MTTANADWKQAKAPRNWSFPRDHGAHPDFKTEWWYFTGNLKTKENQHLGYQFTFFRQGVQTKPNSTESTWSIRDLYFSHLAVSDIKNKKFYSDEKVSRGNLGQADYSQERMDIKLHDWSIQQTNKDQFELFAESNEITLTLSVKSTKPLIKQGHNGLSQKTDAPGEASYYYSYTRLATTGQILIKGKSYDVEGTSWFDHEFMSNMMTDRVVGWDWFSIQLETGDELMLYQIRDQNGMVTRWSKATYIDTEGDKLLLDPTKLVYQITNSWRSPHTKATYPSGWTLEYPPLKLKLQVKPILDDQEMILKQFQEMAYWEGSCHIQGKIHGKNTKGYGYTELTGYASPIQWISE